MIDRPSQRGVQAALEAMEVEAAAIAATREAARDALPAALEVLGAMRGRVIVSGLGKSGLIGAKIAATLMSTGTSAQFVHAADALHGDAGAVTEGDVAILISYSGETAEVCRFASMLRERSVPVIAMTGSGSSTLSGYADVVLSIMVEREADPLNLAPTASSACTLALGDALASGLMAMTGFGPNDFAARHPGGVLGVRLTGPDPPRGPGTSP